MAASARLTHPAPGWLLRHRLDFGPRAATGEAYLAGRMADYSSRPPRRWSRWLPAGLLTGLLLLGGSLFRGSGLGWDERSDHYLGVMGLRYVASYLPAALAHRLPLPPDPRAPALPDDPLRYYGLLVEMPPAALGGLFYRGDPRGYYFLRHFYLFSLFSGAVLAFYGLVLLRFNSWRWALLGAGLLLLSPRIFAEAFYNGKDVGFLSLFTIAMLTLHRLRARPGYGRALLHALASGAAIGARLLGLLLPGLTLGALVLAAWAAPNPRARRQLLALLVVYLVATSGAAVAAWPYLWQQPWAHLREALAVMSHFPWPRTVLYTGRLVPATVLPWHYLPVWLLITTPLPYSLAALLGVGTGLRALARRGWGASLRSWSGQFDGLTLGWLLAPPALVVGLHSVVYDGWRHVYFIYPALLLLALRGARAGWQYGRRATGWPRAAAGTLLLLVGLELGRAGWFLVRAYPNAQVYFSCLPAATAERLFERDYWGLSYRYGLEWLLAHDPSPVITIAGPQPSVLYVNTLILKPEQRRRLRLVPAGRAARYFLTAYRWHPQPYADSLGGPEVLAYRPGGAVKTLSIFRRDSLARPWPPAVPPPPGP